MAFPNSNARVAAEIRFYLSSSAQSLLSITPGGEATENVGGTITWDEIQFVRYPIERAEPKEITDIYKRFTIDHTVKGRDQRKTGAFGVMFQNTNTHIRRYRETENLIRIAWHVEDATTADEFESIWLLVKSFILKTKDWLVNWAKSGKVSRRQPRANARWAMVACAA